MQSKTGGPLAGATVTVNGNSKVKVKAGPDGSFTINAAGGDVLQIANVGYEPPEVSASFRVIVHG